MSRIKIYGIAMVVLLAGCGPQGERVMIENVPNPIYSNGYRDGCESARAQLHIAGATARKDVKLFVANNQYNRGWAEGYDECMQREKRVLELSKKQENMRTPIKEDTLRNIGE